jgi:hypothetical protein
LAVLDTLEKWIKNGTKGRGDIPYKFYVNEMDIGNTFILTKCGERSSCIVRLFTINALNIKDKAFCEKVDLWLTSLINRSSLLSVISTRERFKFITAQKEKIFSLMDKIQNI